MTPPKQSPTIDNITPLSSSEAKWSELQKISWTDETGQSRVWEACNRKTRGSGGIDAVAIAPILLQRGRPARVLLITQFRPPVGKTCVEFPAGLIDEGETPEQSALRELREETGYEGKVVSLTPTIVSDPGLTTANMQFAVVEVTLGEDEKEPEQHLESGEHIERHVVPLRELHERLVEFSKREGVVVDARLFHFAAGLHFARVNGGKYGLE